MINWFILISSSLEIFRILEHKSAKFVKSFSRFRVCKEKFSHLSRMKSINLISLTIPKAISFSWFSTPQSICHFLYLLLDLRYTLYLQHSNTSCFLASLNFPKLVLLPIMKGILVTMSISRMISPLQDILEVEKGCTGIFFLRIFNLVAMATLDVGSFAPGCSLIKT